MAGTVQDLIQAGKVKHFGLSEAGARTIRRGLPCHGAEAFEYATAKLSAGSRFTNNTRQGNLYSMVDRKQELVVVKQTERYIVIVIGQDEGKVKTISERLVEKLKGA